MLTDLSAYRDVNRLFVVFAPSKEDARLIRQERLLRGSASGFKERDLLKLVFLSGETALRRKYRIAKNEFRMLLVGKDGIVAFSSKDPVSPKTVFARIDAMPMRRAEMRRRKG